MLKEMRRIHDDPQLECQDSFIQATPKQKRVSIQQDRKKQEHQEMENGDARPIDGLVNVGTL